MITKIDPDGVRAWIDKYFIPAPLSTENSVLFTTLLMMEIRDSEINPELLKEVDEWTNLRKILVHRVCYDPVYQYTVSKYLSVFLAVALRSPGSIIMVLAMIQKWVFDNNAHNSHINLTTFSKIFPIGLGSEETLDHMWNSQKVFIKGYPSDNMLDISEFYTSITCQP